MASIEALYKLQELEAALRKNRSDRDDVGARLERDAAVEQARAQAARAHRALATLEQEQATLDDEVQETVERLRGLDERLYSGATAAAKDLLALQKEIATLQKKQASLEERLLAKMGQVETAQSRAAELDATYVDADAHWRGALPAMQQEQQQLERQALELAQDRDDAESALSAADLKGFRSLEAAKGQAIARVERGMCGGCAITVPSHELQIARTTSDAVRCPNCNRFLYAK